MSSLYEDITDDENNYNESENDENFTDSENEDDSEFDIDDDDDEEGYFRFEINQNGDTELVFHYWCRCCDCERRTCM
jgi:hypothetical protein